MIRRGQAVQISWVVDGRADGGGHRDHARPDRQFVVFLIISRRACADLGAAFLDIQCKDHRRFAFLLRIRAQDFRPAGEQVVDEIAQFFFFFLVRHLTGRAEQRDRAGVQ